MDQHKIDQLRKRAEEILQTRQSEINIEKYKGDVMHLVEELSVYQIELELQNQDLREKQVLLDQEKQRFADLYFNAPIGYFLFNRKGIILDLNHKAGEILGTTNFSYKNRPFVIFLKNRETEKFFGHISDVFQQTESKEIITEISIENKKNEIRYLRLKSNIFQNQYCRTLAEDITAEKLAQSRIDELNKRLEASMSAGNMAWWELELPSGKVSFNENKARMIGRDPAKFIHYKDFMELVHPEDYEPTMEAFRQHLYGNKPVYECEYRIRHINGKYIWFHDIGKIVEKNEEGFKLTGIVTNISERKHAEEKMTLFRLGMDNSSDQVFLIDPEKMKFVDVNETACKALGYSFEEMLEMGPQDIKPQFTRKKLSEVFNQLLANNLQDGILETGHKTKAGLLIPMEVRLKSFQTSGKSLIIAIARDVTQQKEAENKIIESEKRYHSIFDNSISAILLIDGYGRYLNVNRQYSAITGYNAEDIVQTPIGNITHPDDVGRVREALQKMLSQKIKIFRDEIRLFHKNGQILWIQLHANIYYNLQNEFEYILVEFTDITERKKAEDLIRESEAKFRAISENANEGIVLINNEGNILYANKATGRIFETAVEEILGKNIHETLGRNIFGDEHTINFEKWKKSGKGNVINQKITVNTVTFQGEEKYLELSVSSVLHKDTWYAVGIINDITTLKNNEKTLKELNATKDKFFNIIAHDLRSPFSTILGFSEMLVEDLEELSLEEIRLYVEAIHKASGNTYKLLESLLIWARVQQGNIPFRPSVINLCDICSETISLLKFQAQAKEIEISLDVPDDIEIFIDNEMLQTLIRNLVSNALKYTTPGGRVELKAVRQNDEVLFSVSDDGIGMELQTLNSLFKLGETVSMEGTAGERGTGFGLMICKEFVEKHGGRIYAESTPGKGSTFFFTIPEKEVIKP
jgi:PAS domain S-box-containing protein